MKGIVCKVCGYVALNGNIPERCPACNAPKESFEVEEDAIHQPADPADLTDLEKKHIPVITVVKDCGLIPQGCQDVHARLGEIQHPMTPEHFIQHLDFYLEDVFISRVTLTPEQLNPAAALHLKAQEGKLTVVSLCNLHGIWMQETVL